MLCCAVCHVVVCSAWPCCVWQARHNRAYHPAWHFMASPYAMLNYAILIVNTICCIMLNLVVSQTVADTLCYAMLRYAMLYPAVLCILLCVVLRPALLSMCYIRELLSLLCCCVLCCAVCHVVVCSAWPCCVCQARHNRG